MDTFGRYRLQFEPSQEDISPSVKMEISGQASLDQMLSLFDCFLKANGYLYDGEVTIEDTESPNPYRTTVPGSSETDFIPFNAYDFESSVIYGGCGNDTISFGAAQPVEFGAKTWDDVISFG